MLVRLKPSSFYLHAFYGSACIRLLHHIEYTNQVWHPRHLQDVDKLDKVQKKGTKMGKKYHMKLLLHIDKHEGQIFFHR